MYSYFQINKHSITKEYKLGKKDARTRKLGFPHSCDLSNKNTRNLFPLVFLKYSSRTDNFSSSCTYVLGLN